MKLDKKEHDYLNLKQAIFDTVSMLTIETVMKHKRWLAKNPKVKDLEMRFRWDLLWATAQEVREPILKRIYKYANDEHIDTALKHIVNALSL